MKIATKTGDDGSTGLFGGRRVSKSALVIEVLGCLDELQAFLGWCKVSCEGDFADVLDKVQDDLYGMMGKISGEEGAGVGEKNILWIEELIEKYESDSGGIDGFVKPGKDEFSARLHIARTVCRRAERRAVKYFEKSLPGQTIKNNSNFKNILIYLNRLSDLLFLLGIL